MKVFAIMFGLAIVVWAVVLLILRMQYSPNDPHHDGYLIASSILLAAAFLGTVIAAISFSDRKKF